VFCGNAKMPLPIIEPTTSATSSGSGNSRFVVALLGVAGGATCDAGGVWAMAMVCLLWA
jgi:hypothetical protein